MPVTPRFSLSQDHKHVLLTIHTPYVRPTDAEVMADGRTIHFYCRPYLLRLTLPGECVDDERLRVSYNVDERNGTFTVTVPKATEGEDFKDLDMLTLLAMPGGGHRATAGVGATPPAGADLQAVSTTRSAHDQEVPYLTKPPRGAEDVDEDDEDELLDSLDAAAAQRAYDEREEDNLRRLVEEQLAASAAREGGSGKASSLHRKLQVLRSGKRDPTKPLIEVLANEDFDKDNAAHLAVSASPSEQGSSSSGDALVRSPLEAQSMPEAKAAATEAAAPAIAAARPEDRGIGFNRRFDPLVFFKDLSEDAPLIVDLPHPEFGYAASERAALREAHEDESFDPVHYASDAMLKVKAKAKSGAGETAGARGGGNYVGVSGYETDGMRRRADADDEDEDAEEEEEEEDLAEDPILSEALTMVPWWVSEMQRVLGQRTGGPATGGSGTSDFVWSERETADLLSLAQTREFVMDGALLSASSSQSGPLLAYNPLSHPDTTRFLNCLAGLLFAYAYDHRTTAGEEGGNVESPWTVRTLCPLLSWLDDTCDASAVTARHAHGQPEESGSTESSEGRDREQESRLAALLTVVDLKAGPEVDGSGGAEASKKRGPLIVPIDEDAIPAQQPKVGERAGSALTSNLAEHGTPATAAAGADEDIPLQLQPMLATAAACVRRSLTFPYLRRWDLALTCLSDAATLMMCGRRACLRVLLAVRRYLMSASAGEGAGGGSSAAGDGSSMHYLLNSLFVNDAILALQMKAPTGPAMGAVEGWDHLLLQAGSTLSTVLQPRFANAGESAAAPSLLPPYLHKSLSPYLARWRLEELEANADAIVELAAEQYATDGKGKGGAGNKGWPLGVPGVELLLQAIKEGEEDEDDEDDSSGEDESSEDESDDEAE